MVKQFLKDQGGYQIGNDNQQRLLLQALDHAHLNMNHVGNYRASGWVVDPVSGLLDIWAPLDFD